MTRARQLWKGATQHERLLWRHLRNRQLQGWKFRRQHPVDRYIIDFYCPEARLAIELDGGGHNFANRESLDQEQTRFLASKNILVLRFWNYLINRELRSVLETIWSTLKRRGNPSP
jgi:very-short-patch-repair endonuclease